MVTADEKVISDEQRNDIHDDPIFKWVANSLKNPYEDYRSYE